MKQRFVWIAVLLAALPLAAIACQSGAKPATTSPPAATTTPPGTSTTGQGQGVFGDLSSVNGNTLVLTTTEGQTTVQMGSNTVIEKIVDGSISDLKQGDAVTVVGSTDANGNITATSIAVRPQGSPGAFIGSGNGGGGQRTFPGGQGNGTGTGFPGVGGRFTIGTLASINDNTLTVTTSQGQVTVSVDANTTVRETETASASDLKTSESLSVFGTRDASGNVTAAVITIQFTGGAAAVSPTSTPTPSSGPSIATTSLPDASVGTAYSQALTASGGSAPYSWSIIDGSLPNGLSLDASTSEITGSPTASGKAAFTVKMTDNAGATATQKLTITVDPAMSADALWLPAGDVGVSYSHNLLGYSQGTNPHTYTWSIPADTLPPGLYLDAETPEIDGTPTVTGTYSFTAQLSGATVGLQSIILTMTINPAPAINATSLADGQVGVSYFGALSGSGGTIPYSWSITEGALPDGLSMDSSTSSIIGTPTTAGTFTFTVTMTDANGAVATQRVSLKIDPAPSAGQ